MGVFGWLLGAIINRDTFVVDSVIMIQNAWR